MKSYFNPPDEENFIIINGHFSRYYASMNLYHDITHRICQRNMNTYQLLSGSSFFKRVLLWLIVQNILNMIP